jgi:hypothetical protein
LGRFLLFAHKKGAADDGASNEQVPFKAIIGGSLVLKVAAVGLPSGQFPKRTPLEATPFTRVMPLASSGASSLLSAASTASFRTAVGDSGRNRSPFRSESDHDSVLNPISIPD